MKIGEDVVPVYEFRPLQKHCQGEMFRFNLGDWIPDDGEHDLAFVSCGTAYYFHVPNRLGIIWSWVANGRWGAHVAEHPGGNAWHRMLRDGETEWGDTWQKYYHENEIAGKKAMEFAIKNRCSANGTGPEFHINDPYIASGLVRERDTKEIVKFPDIFNCMYCGEIDWRKVEAVSK